MICYACNRRTGVQWVKTCPHCEAEIHKALKAYRATNARGAREWFRCNRYFAIETVKLAIEEVYART